VPAVPARAAICNLRRAILRAPVKHPKMIHGIRPAADAAVLLVIRRFFSFRESGST
jgi:hypothetical protein